MFLCQHACKFCDISKGTVDLFPSVLSEVMLQMTFLMKTAKKSANEIFFCLKKDLKITFKNAPME